MKSIYFYSENELSIMRKAISSNEKMVSIAKRLSKQLKRPYVGVYCKLMKLKKQQNPSIDKRDAKGVLLPKGFTFDFTPKKAVMHKDRVVLYF